MGIMSVAYIPLNVLERRELKPNASRDAKSITADQDVSYPVSAGVQADIRAKVAWAPVRPDTHGGGVLPKTGEFAKEVRSKV